jgi:hypothetical protein
MKITTASKKDKAFTPVPFTVLVESQQELDTWRALFNHHPFCSLVNMSQEGYVFMDKLGANKENADAIWEDHLKGVTFPPSK